MIYSCFNPKSGTYRYFADGKQHAINADLPVPKLPGNTGRIGVPSMHAARPFPSGAKPIGEGWHARGVVVQCPGQALGAMSDTARTGLYVAGIGAVIAFAVWWDRGRRHR